MRKLLYIVNPISGTRDKGALQELIDVKTTAAGIDYQVFSSVANGDYSFLDVIIPQERFTDIVIAGGDGTVNAAIAGLKKHQLPFGIIPCGSGNGLAFSAGIPKFADKALEVVFNGQSEWADAFLINNRFACMLCGLGFDAQVAHDFANAGKRGMMTYVKKVVQNFFSARTYPFGLRFNETEINMDAYFISIANSNQYGNNFTIAPKASLTDGLLDVVVMAKQPKWSVLLQTAMQVGGYTTLKQVEEIDAESSVIYFQTNKILISNPQAALIHIDGDPADSASVIDIQVLPRCFQLIFPPKS